MFERYSEPARRAIFFARYEASQFGSTTIETEHLLLGLTTGDRGLLQQLLSGATTIEELRRQIEGNLEVREKVATTIDLPLSNECIRILAYAAEEADGLGNAGIGAGHILLGILREDACPAAKLLSLVGLDLKSLREKITQVPDSSRRSLRESAEEHLGRIRGFLQPHSAIPRTPLPAAGVVPDIETAMRIAEAVWLPRVSATPGDRVSAQTAVLMHGVWMVTGFHERGNTQTNLGAFIQKEDGKILRIHQDAAET